MHRYTYPHTIDNGAGERLTFLRRVPGPTGERVEGENVASPGAGPPMHVHHHQDEVFHVQRGRIGYQRPLAAIVAVMLAGCSAPDGPAADGGVQAPQTVHLTTAALADAPEWGSTVEFSTLGVDTLQILGSESLFARFLADGSLVIANGSNVVRLGRDGAVQRTLARSGDGPGEFRLIVALGVAGDGSLFASDHLTGRLTQFSADGAVVRIVPRLRPFSDAMPASPITVLAGGRTIAVPWQWRPAADAESGVSRNSVVRDAVPVVVYDDEGAPADTVLTLAGLERVGGFVVPFPRSAVYDGRGSRWVAGPSDSLDLMIYDGVTPERRLVAAKANGAPTPRQRSQRDDAVAAMFDAGVGSGLVERQARMSAPATLPDVGGVLVDASSRIWVGRYLVPGDPEREWSVHSPAGATVGRIRLPAFGSALVPYRTELLDATHGRVALMRETDGGEVYVEVRRLEER